MESKKIKDIVLFVLLLVNLFLLVLVVVRQREALRSRETIIRNTVTVFEENGIRLDLDPFPEDGRISALRIRKDETLEQKMASALLGQSRAEELGGGLSHYSGTHGTATFRSNGQFSVKLEPGALPLRGDPEDETWKLLKKMGIKGDKTSLQRMEADGVLLISVRQLASGYPVFDSFFLFRWTEDSLREVSGRRLAGEAVPIERDNGVLSASTALFRFLTAIKNAGDICSEITGMTLGYRFSSSLSDTLEPYWLIHTDTGLYYVNAINGETNRVS